MPTIKPWPLPYLTQLEPRSLASIDLVVVHCTELPDLKMARTYGERILHASGTGNSGHYYIDRDGTIWNFVPPDLIAHHVRGYNPRSLGIELVNTGRYPNWFAADHQVMQEAYSDIQIAALKDLLAYLCQLMPALRFIDGHEHLDTEKIAAGDQADKLIARKVDPGPLFPWEAIMANTQLKRFTTFKDEP